MANPDVFKAAVEPDSTYPFDSAKVDEHQRLELQSKAIKQLTKGRLIHSPIDTVKKILEIGCGTGTTTTQLAQDFPEATVIGVDRAAVPSVHVKPANVTYITGKFEDLVQSDHPALGKGTFDLIYSRFVSQGVGQWSKHIDLCHDLLTPGGFLELHETDGSVLYSAKSPDAQDPDTAGWKWHQFVMDESLKYGVAANDIGRLGDIMEQVGLGNVGRIHYPFVFYPWPARPETEAVGEYCKKFTPMVIKQMIALLGRDKSDPLHVQTLQEEVDQTLGKAEIEGLHFRFYVWFGQKKMA